MKKKIFITLGIVFALAVTTIVGYGLETGLVKGKQSKPSDYKVGVTFNEAVASDKPMLVLFYADWCGYCLRFMPKFVILNTIYSSKYSVVMIDIEDMAYKSLVDSANLTGFPTLSVIDPKYDFRFTVNQGTYGDVSKLKVELDRYLKVRKLLDKTSEAK